MVSLAGVMQRRDRPDEQRPQTPHVQLPEVPRELEEYLAADMNGLQLDAMITLGLPIMCFMVKHWYQKRLAFTEDNVKRLCCESFTYLYSARLAGDDFIDSEEAKAYPDNLYYPSAGWYWMMGVGDLQPHPWQQLCPQGFRATGINFWDHERLRACGLLDCKPQHLEWRLPAFRTEIRPRGKGLGRLLKIF